MHRFLSIAVFALLMVAAPAARAEAPCDTIRGFFSALERHDFQAALAFTAGPAAASLGGVFGAAEEQAARAHAALEVHVKELHLIEGVTDTEGKTPVEVRYDVHVFGRRSFFRSLVRRIVGSSKFVVDRGRIASVGTLLQ